MAGAAVTPTSTVGVSGDEPSNSAFHPSRVNAYRISAVIDRLCTHIRITTDDDTDEFLNLCLSLARGIDFAIANHEIPSRAQELPALLSQVCRSKTTAHLQSAIMVLMISVKNACQCGWFSNQDSEELVNHAKEIASNFCSSSNFDAKATCSLSVTSIMSRFYPRMRMGHQLVFLEVKPGFDAYMSGFHLSKNVKPSPGQKIRLFVVQTDDITTSSCLTSPSKVNFLLNGKGVERRTTLSMDTGPQMPTDVTRMLKYGSNLLQALGEFDGNYAIALAFMSEMPNPANRSSPLQDYEQPTLATADPDAEIIEGPSRVSLNCPISLKQIKTPVKGHSCKHIQCFDFDNYVSMNTRRPSWRCPHCNQHVCFTDIRIDRNMSKILEEVGPNVTDVVVASDGSWNVVMESDDTTNKSVDNISNTGQDEPSPQAEFNGLSNAPANVFDLTLTDDTMDPVISHETEDKKLSPASGQIQSMTTASSIPRTNDVNQTNGGIEDDFWSSVYFSTFEQALSNIQSNELIGGNCTTTSNDIVPPSIIPEPLVFPNQEVEAFRGNSNVTSTLNTMPVSQYPVRNSTVANDYGRLTSIPSHLTRVPNAVQALPAPTPSSSVLQKRSRDSANAFIQSAPSQVSQPLQMMSNTSHAIPFSMNQHNMGVQRKHPFPSVPSSQPTVPVQTQTAYRGFNEHRSLTQSTVPVQAQTAYRAFNEHRNSTPPHMVSPRMLQSPMPSTASFPQSRSHLGVSRAGTNCPVGALTGQLAHTMVDSNRNVPMARPATVSKPAPPFAIPSSNRAMPSVAHQRSNDATSPQVAATTSVDSTEQNWQPAARMRGALSGQAYTDAMNKYIIQPSQQAQAARPTSVSAQLQALVADRSAQFPSAEPVPRLGVSEGISPLLVSGSGVSEGILPARSSGMN